MSLPKINHPLFDVTIPSNNQTVKMRPFLVKEEKVLLMAQSTGNPKDVVNAITQVVNNCLVDTVDVRNLTMFDMEYLFVKLRARSINNKIEIFYKDDSDSKQYKVEVDLDQVEIIRSPDHNNQVQITEDMGLILKYPKAEMLENTSGVLTELDLYFEVVKYCIDKVYDADMVYNISDSTPEEVDEFVATLDVTTFKAIQHFLETMPKLHYEATYITDAGIERKVILQNLNDFFMLG